MQFVKESLINASAERVFAFHERPDALRLLTPPWEKTRIIESASISELGSRTIIETKVGPIKIRWVARHTKYEPPHLFEDIQIKGPFRSWRHRHKIESSDNGARLRDEITYEPPFRFLGKLFSPLFIERRLKRLFDYRHQVTRELVEGESAPAPERDSTPTVKQNEIKC